MPLTEDDKRLVHHAFYRGPAALIDEGYEPTDLREFFDRTEVQFELALLKREYDLHDGLKSRGKFIARRALHQLIEPAQAVLLQGLAGPEYVRDAETNNVMRDSRGYPLLVNPDITQSQRWAVKTILDGAGINDFRISMDPGIDNNVELLFKKAETPRTIDAEPLGQTPEEQALSRERVRTAIDTLIPRLPAARERFRAEFSEIVKDGRGGKRKSKKKKAKKSSAGKATVKKRAKKKKTARKASRSGKAS